MPGAPGNGTTVRGPAVPGPNGVPRGGIARHAAAPLLCAATLALAACGATNTTARPGPAAGAAAVTTTSATPARPARAASVPAPSPSAAATAAAAVTQAPGVRARPARTSAPADPPLPSGLPSSAPLRVTLGSACVTPGGEQRLVVETLPEAYVAFDNLYADGRTGAAYGGAEPAGRADGTGRFTAVWRVAPGTPAGRVRLDVGVSARTGSAITMTYYRLAARC